SRARSLRLCASGASSAKAPSRAISATFLGVSVAPSSATGLGCSSALGSGSGASTIGWTLIRVASPADIVAGHGRRGAHLRGRSRLHLPGRGRAGASRGGDFERGVGANGGGSGRRAAGG